MNLRTAFNQPKFPTRDEKRGTAIPIQSKNQDKLGDYYCRPLKVDRLPGIIVEVADNQHGRVRIARDLGQKPFKGCEKRRIIQRPF